MGIRRIIDANHQTGLNGKNGNSKKMGDITHGLKRSYLMKVEDIQDDSNQRKIKDIMRGLKKSYPITIGDIPDKLKEPERYQRFMQSDDDNREIYIREYSKKWQMYKELFEEIDLNKITQIPISYRHARFRTLADVGEI